MQATLRAATQPRRVRYNDVGLLDFIPRITPRWEPPVHLAALVHAIERSEHEPVRVCVSVPPRHSKTETILHSIAWCLARHPDQTCAYASYSADISRSKSRLARDYAARAGVVLRDDSKALNEWRTPEGGGMLATGVGGPLTGHGAHRLFVDDPCKNRAEAESRVIRNTIHDWFTSTAMTRVEPGGSVFVCHTRWHDEDIIGRLSRDTENKWEVINLPALNERGEALWPSRWPADVLEKRRREVGEYDWASLYMGQPMPRGAGLFETATVVETVPAGPSRYAIGLDFAYTTSTKADYSVAVVLAEIAGIAYVVNVVRRQCAATAFASELARLTGIYPGAPMFAFVGGTEKGVVDLLNASGLRIHSAPALTDKFVRAQSCAAAWNNGNIAIPRTAHWASDFISEISAFPTSAHDDQVDALVNAFHILHRHTMAPNRYMPENVYG